MWYFAWSLGTLLACCLGIVTALWVEQLENSNGSLTENGSKQ